MFVVPPALVPRRTSPKDSKFPLKTVLTTPTLKVSVITIGSLKVVEELNVAAASNLEVPENPAAPDTVNTSSRITGLSKETSLSNLATPLTFKVPSPVTFPETNNPEAI